ncbi:MAG: polyketide synthase, partial [Vicinamibacterales bacterium]
MTRHHPLPDGASPQATREPIAIVGLGCRLPGADSVEAFWSLLVSGGQAIGEIPRDRFDVDALFDATPATPGHIMSRWGGFLDGLDRFDAGFFGIAPREADRLDPQQRLLLEAGWHALEDAGHVRRADPALDARTGVFVGLWLSEYEARLFRDPGAIDFHMTLGSGRYSASGRLSYAFGFEGPSLTIDTACSSSLVAVHLACRSLWSGECEMAIAGGANAILEPSITIAYSQSRMMAPDGRCKFGDARADGYVRSDGAGVVVLKTLSRARADGDRIHAVIHGGAVNNDGDTGFLATPSRAGQETLLRRAYADAGVSPGDVRYVEAHGTGTRAGDPVELGALGAVLAEGRAPGSRCRVGSVKTNIGHTEGAAGVAGLIKVVLSIAHQQLPASLHVETPTPEVPWADLPIELQRRTGPWPAGDGPLLAGVSAFGIAGTNAHLVVGSGLGSQPDGADDDESEISGGLRALLLPVSSHTPETLDERLGDFAAAAEAGTLAP